VKVPKPDSAFSDTGNYLSSVTRYREKVQPRFDFGPATYRLGRFNLDHRDYSVATISYQIAPVGSRNSDSSVIARSCPTPQRLAGVGVPQHYLASSTAA